MATVIRTSFHSARPLLIGSAGAAIILLSIGAAFLSGHDGWSGSKNLAGLLLAAGVLESTAGSLRSERQLTAMLAGGATSMAGLIFLTAPVEQFIPAIYVIIGWLGARGLLLTMAGLQVGGALRLWTYLSAAMDLALAGILLAGLAAITFAISLFGPTAEMTMSFSAILALSFVITGGYLIEVASSDQ